MDDVTNQDLVNQKVRQLRFTTAKFYSAYKEALWKPETFLQYHDLGIHYTKDAYLLLEAVDDLGMTEVSDLEKVNRALSSSHENHFEAMYQHEKLLETGEDPLDALYTGPLYEAVDEFFEIESEVMAYYDPSAGGLLVEPDPEA